MKRLFLFSITFLLVTSARVAAPQVEIPLPESHWAYGDLAALARAGLAPGYQAEDFDGRRAFTREDMARAVSSVRDHYTTSPAAFSAAHLALLSKLQGEFQEELDRAGQGQPIQDAAASPAVPPSHWAYKALENFAARGLVTGAAAHQFAGGRVFTRAEMAEFTRQLLASRNAGAALFTGEDDRILQYLATEFKDELAVPAPGHEVPAPPSKTPPWSVSGAGNLYLGVTKGNKTSLANRLTLSADSPRMESYFAGDIDNADRAGSDVDFGRAYTFEMSRKLIGFHSNRDDAATDDFLLFGDVNNVDFDRGLVLGAANIKGAFLSAARSAAHRSAAFWGEDSAGREILGVRHTRRLGDDTTIAALALKEYLGTGDMLHAAGLHLNRESASRRLSLDYAVAEGAGHGFFASLRRDITQNLTALWEYRDYRDFTLAHNNPPQYQGRSGGNGENETSYLMRVEWDAGDKWGYILSRDHIYSPGTGRKTNVLFAQEYRPGPQWALAWSWEKEQGEGVSEAERGVRVRYAGLGDATLAGSWKRTVRAGGPSSTMRLDLTQPVMNRLGRVLLSFTRRKAASRRTYSYRTRVSRSLGAGRAVSLSYDYTGTATNRMDMNYTWKY